MADTATTYPGLDHLPGNNEGILGQPVDFDIRGLGRRLPKTEAPEGWVKKIERSREGKVWVGFFHLWTTDVHGFRGSLGWQGAQKTGQNSSFSANCSCRGLLACAVMTPNEGEFKL